MLARDLTPDEIEAVADEAADDEAMAQYEAKGGISHTMVRAWLLSWGADAELPCSKVGD